MKRLVCCILIFLMIFASVSVVYIKLSSSADSSMWYRRGNVLVGTQAWEFQDGYYNVFETNIIIEGNPQILTGETTVFKMWHSGGWSQAATGYAESADGLTWTEYSGNPVVDLEGLNYLVAPHVMRINETTLWMYVTDADNACIRLYNSSDGIHWTLINANVIGKGGAGAWDSYSFANPFVWKEADNDWRMQYTGNSISFPMFKTGYATSTDGISWTKYDGDGGPVIDLTPGSHGRTQVIKIGMHYYCWVLAGSSGQLPSDEYMLRSTDLITWEWFPNPSISWDITFPRLSEDEGPPPSTVGQVADIRNVEYQGKIWKFYSAATDGRYASGYQHIKLAQYNGTFYDYTGETPPEEPTANISFISINGGTNGTTIYSSNPTFIWTRNASASKYWLQVSNTSLFAPSDIAVNITNINDLNYPSYYDENTTAVSFMLPPANSLPSYKIYYCRVRAYVET